MQSPQCGIDIAKHVQELVYRKTSIPNREQNWHLVSRNAEQNWYLVSIILKPSLAIFMSLWPPGVRQAFGKSLPLL